MKSLDKDVLTNHIRDEQLKIRMYKVIDKAFQSMRSHTTVMTDFLNPWEIKNAEAILNSFRDLSYISYGGYEGAERKRIFIFPDYLTEETADIEFGAIRIDGDFRFSSVSHRDYLGSIMGLGITRERVGDILVHDDFCQVVLDRDISDFVVYNLERIGRARVSVVSIDCSELSPPEIEYKTGFATVQSLRVDNIISKAYNLSSQKGTDIVKAGYVRVNYEPITSSSRRLNEGDLISVRGYGRVILDAVEGVTKKDRTKIKLKYYV